MGSISSLVFGRVDWNDDDVMGWDRNNFNYDARPELGACSPDVLKIMFGKQKIQLPLAGISFFLLKGQIFGPLRSRNDLPLKWSRVAAKERR
jgi:hypothetical protein